MRVACIFGHVERVIEVDGQSWRFDWHDRFGPTLLSQRGEPIKAPPERSHFWDALRWWDRQGRRTNVNGLCLWSPMPDEPVTTVLSRTHRYITGYRIPAWAEGQGTEYRADAARAEGV